MKQVCVLSVCASRATRVCIPSMHVHTRERAPVNDVCVYVCAYLCVRVCTCMLVLFGPDMPHDTDYPYPIRILTDF